MAGIGIDIGSTATKAVVADPSGAIAVKLVIPPGVSRVGGAQPGRWAPAWGGLGAEEMPGGREGGGVGKSGGLGGRRII